MRIEVENGVTVLYPGDGKWLNKDDIYTDRVLLGKFDSADNWTEVESIPDPAEDEEATLADLEAALEEVGV